MIVLINPNSTAAMTEAMLSTAQAQAGAIPVQGWTSTDGPAAIQGPEDGALAVPPMLELVRKASADGAQAIIIGCFDDTGLDSAREVAQCPVIGIGQAAYHLAAIAGGRFSVVTTLAVSVPILEENIQHYGLSPYLSRVRASGVPVLDLEDDPVGASNRIVAEVQRAEAEDDVRSVVLGCGGMVHLSASAQAQTKLRVIDGVRAATAVASGFV